MRKLLMLLGIVVLAFVLLKLCGFNLTTPPIDINGKPLTVTDAEVHAVNNSALPIYDVNLTFSRFDEPSNQKHFKFLKLNSEEHATVTKLDLDGWEIHDGTQVKVEARGFLFTGTWILSDNLKKSSKVRLTTTPIPELPQPKPQGIAKWLDGQRIVVEKHFLGDDVWTLATGEVSNVKVLSVTKNLADQVYTESQKRHIADLQTTDKYSVLDNLYTVTFSFQSTKVGKGIECQGFIVYAESASGSISGINFTPSTVTKLGVW